MKINSPSLTRVAVTTGLLLGGFALAAVAQVNWTGPGGIPPNNNVKAPINVGNSTQYKQGQLGIGALSGITGTEKLNVFGTAKFTTIFSNEISTNQLSVTTVPAPTAGMVLSAKDSSGLVEWKAAGGGINNPQILSAEVTLNVLGDRLTNGPLGQPPKFADVVFSPTNAVNVPGAEIDDTVVVSQRGSRCATVVGYVESANSVRLKFVVNKGIHLSNGAESNVSTCSWSQGPYQIRVIK